MSRLRTMSDEECREALSSRTVGRAAVQTDTGPHIVPVNYAVAGNSLFFRALPASVLARYACTGTVAFEIDEVDPVRRTAWSVVARGPVVHAPVNGDEDAARLRMSGLPVQAVSRVGRELYELRWRELSGHWIAPEDDPDGDDGEAT